MRYKPGQKVIICVNPFFTLQTSVGFGAFNLNPPISATIHDNPKGTLATVVGYIDKAVIEVKTEFGTTMLQESDVRPNNKLSQVLK